MTKCLDLDIGNSRTKWRCGADVGSCKVGKLPELRRPIERVRVASVVSNHESLAAEIQQTFGVEPEFAVSSHTLAGVTNCYDDPSKLGVDRWLALVAGWNRVHSSVLVIDAGTALTVDVADEKGQHLGGYIAPGLETMRASLASDTENVQVAFQSNCDTNLDFGRNTQEAVQHGLKSMAVAWLAQCRALAESSCGIAPAVLLTGGEGQRLACCLDYPCEVLADLVLDGLAIALP